MKKINQTSSQLNKKSKKTTYRMRKVFANHTSDKGLVYRIHKELLLPNKITMSITKWAKLSIDIAPKKIYKWPVQLSF